ncbi:isochorismatase family cysteine hydrolase [Streptomyces lavendulae]|uniref:Maleamate amidohydrolase n=1 Tax=Streptomyces lavendulae subsp. lavendulae TaxID=58340 RepID=A0A2K8P9D9_STRLA|nr:isochorismatase family cysteine hydrolase [Streptomyces lavendulae]ATZ23362.1 Maleamate amidohydrolase [Streptomyces lavendulae subsp. lavendulae]QUQ53193.1 Maleamate amidohydrolase [Streptomyces lavendulae subsp. lavendulae]
MAKTAVVIIDMLNTYDHQDADALVPSVEQALPAMIRLLEEARRRGLPVIYVNDNFGKWRSHHGEILEAALTGPHAHLVEPLRPDEDSYFIVKARHSAFYETPLAYLLGTLGVGHLVLCGQVTEQCVLYSALDAHIRHLSVTVARDAVAHIHPDLADAAVNMMEINMAARIVPAAEAFT